MKLLYNYQLYIIIALLFCNNLTSMAATKPFNFLPLKDHRIALGKTHISNMPKDSSSSYDKALKLYITNLPYKKSSHYKAFAIFDSTYRIAKAVACIIEKPIQEKVNQYFLAKIKNKECEIISSKGTKLLLKCGQTYILIKTYGSNLSIVYIDSSYFSEYQQKFHKSSKSI